MEQSVQEELGQTLARLSLEKLYDVLRFAHELEEHMVAPPGEAREVREEEAAQALADFVAAAGCGHSGDQQSALRVDDILYNRPKTS